jgi:hypothetical protein
MAALVASDNPLAELSRLGVSLCRAELPFELALAIRDRSYLCGDKLRTWTVSGALLQSRQFFFRRFQIRLDVDDVSHGSPHLSTERSPDQIGISRQR